MKGLEAKLLGSDARFPLEQRIFHIVMLTGVMLTVFGTVIDGLNGHGVWIDLAFIACLVANYIISRRYRGFRVVSVVAAVALVAFTPYQWIISFGTSGMIPVYTVIFIVAICMMLRGLLRVILIVSMLVVVTLLVYYDAFILKILQPVATWSWAVQMVMILAATAMLVVFQSNAYQKEKRRSESYAQVVESNVCQQAYYVENLERLIMMLRSERHDFNNHLSVLHGLLEGGDIDKAKAYAAGLVRDSADYQSIVNIPYPALRTLLNHKLSVARDCGVALRLNVDLPEGLDINEFDLTVILGNLLDNAYEACTVLAEGELYIKFSLRFQPDYLVIHIANPYTPMPEGRHKEKPDPENHGYGLKNVEYFVSKHEGLMEVKREDCLFSVDIALPVSQHGKPQPNIF